MIKYAGIILLSGAVSMYGAYLSLKVKENIKLRQALLELIIHIRSHVEASAEPIYDIFAIYESRQLEKAGVLAVLKSTEHNAFGKAIDGIYDTLPERIAILYATLASELGKSKSRTSEVEMLTRYISDIKAEEERLKRDDFAKTELYKRLGILCGLLLALILI